MKTKLKITREQNKYTSLEIANKLGISKSFYSQLENGHRRLTYDMALKIAKIFKTKPDELFYDEYIKHLRK